MMWSDERADFIEVPQYRHAQRPPAAWVYALWVAVLGLACAGGMYLALYGAALLGG